MSLDFLPFSRPSIGEDEIAAVEQVLRSGWITTGPKNQELEQRFAERLGCRHAVALSSATGALHVTLLALGIGPGDEVITPSLTWVSTANVITLLGATPVFVDVDRDTLMCSAQVRFLIAWKEKIAVPREPTGRPRYSLPTAWAASSTRAMPWRPATVRRPSRSRVEPA